MASPNSLYNESLLYLDGKGVPKDVERSFALCAEAASSGHHDAVLAMGWHYDLGVGVGKDVQLAEFWYKKSARQGEAKAMFNLGGMAYDRRDYAEAKVWYERGLAGGHAGSGCGLAKVLWRLAESPRDRRYAVTVLQNAASSNIEEAARLLKVYEKCRRAVA